MGQQSTSLLPIYLLALSQGDYSVLAPDEAGQLIDSGYGRRVLSLYTFDVPVYVFEAWPHHLTWPDALKLALDYLKQQGRAINPPWLN